LKTNIFAGVLIIVSGLLSPLTGIAEGTKQIKPDSAYNVDLWIQSGGWYSCFATEQCGPDQKLFVHIAHPGEKIYLGFRSDSLGVTFKIKLNNITKLTKTIVMVDGMPGYIKYYSQAVAGPVILDPHGYIPVTFVPSVAGDYSIDFVMSGAGDVLPVNLFDITVIDTTISPYAAINGRLWSKDWGFNTYNFSVPTNTMPATQFILTADSIVTSFNYNHMDGWNFDVTSTKNGCFPPPYPWDSSCLSREGNHHYAQYKIFVNDPDSTEYPTGTLGVILGDTVSVFRSCNRTFTFTFVVNKPGTVKLNIETNLSPGIQPEDLTLTRNVLKGTNTIVWNGTDGLGNPVTCGDSVRVAMNYINGLTNIALFDVERNLKGFIIELVRPPGLPISTFWNDTLLAAHGGQTQLTGCIANPPDTGCHTWTGGVGYGLGSGNTVNTWWYASTNVLELGLFRVECVPEVPANVLGPDTVCSSENVLYHVDPDPLPGAELTGYNWVLTDIGSGSVLFDSLDIGPSVRIHFSNYPSGNKKLKVRGNNSLCGFGPFGPGSDGSGILIEVDNSPQITNPLQYFTICSGDTTNILLQSSMTGSTFSYIAVSTSPLVTGQSSGIQNPIRQRLLNSGIEVDSVLYSVVPFAAPCPGDTTVFIVAVLPADSLTLPIAASANPSCENAVVDFSVDSLFGGPFATYQWSVNGIQTGPDSPVFTYIPLNGDLVGCIITSPDFCNPDQSATGMEITMTVLPNLPVMVSLSSFPDPVCQGDSVFVNAIPFNGGSIPAYQWLVNGTPAGIDSSQFAFVPANGDRVTCILTSDMTCVVNNQASDSLVVNVQPELRVTDTTLCFGIPFLAGGSWQTVAGTYYDTLIPPVNCIRIIQTNLQYQPQISVNLGNDTTICNDPLTLGAFVPGATYLWQDGSTDSVLIITGPGEYDVMVTVGQCSEADSITIGECPAQLWFPNAFTPNSDGLNDTFHPKGYGVEQFSMQIFNRWGEMIFETHSLEPGWDGTKKGTPCPEDTYLYKATFQGSTGEKYSTMGTVTLQR
jgi:gliding motility-associated-like protein